MSESRDYEAEARRDGWVPQDDWKGEEDKWVSAQEFVERGEKITSIQKSKIERLESRLAEKDKAFGEFKEFMETARERDRKEAEKRIRDLEAQRAEAISEGDGQRFTKLDNEINDLRESSREKPQSTSDVNAMAQEWQSNNNWYGSDDDMTIYADGISSRVASEGYTGQSYFNELSRRVRDRFPEKFQNPNREMPSTVEEPGSQGSVSQSRTFKDLPADAQAQYERFKRQMPDFTKEQYVAQYDWD